MSYQEIDLSTPGDGQGDDARTGGAKINAQFKELFSRAFKLNDWLVSRWVYDPNVLSFDAFKDNDKIRGWVDAEKTRYVEGIMLTASGFVFPDDLDNTGKFLKLIDKQIL